MESLNVVKVSYRQMILLHCKVKKKAVSKKGIWYYSLFVKKWEHLHLASRFQNGKNSYLRI